jgi:GNAT superfamily N-acetyltransferase
MAGPLTIRPAGPSDRATLRRAIVNLQEYERPLHDTRLPGEQIADRYLDWLLERAGASGIIMVAELDGSFAGFVAGWVEQTENIAETPDSNRFGLISDVYVLPEFRGRRLASRLIGAVEHYLRRTGVRRLRICGLAANTSARSSYVHAGFSPYEVVYEKLIGGDDE